MALTVDALSHRAAAREILAYEGVELARLIVATERGKAGLRAALESELGRLPRADEARAEVLRRWRAEARE